VHVFDGTTLAFYWHEGPCPIGPWPVAQCPFAAKAVVATASREAFLRVLNSEYENELTLTFSAMQLHFMRYYANIKIILQL